MEDNTTTGKPVTKVRKRRTSSPETEKTILVRAKIDGNAHGKHSSSGTLDGVKDALNHSSADIPASGASIFWLPINGTDRDALATLILHHRPQTQDSSATVSAGPSQLGNEPLKPTPRLSETSVVHAIPGRARLRVTALKHSPSLAEGLHRLLLDQPGVTDVQVNDRCSSVTVTCDPRVWTADQLCSWLQPLTVQEVISYKSVKEQPESLEATSSDEAGDELWYRAPASALPFLSNRSQRR